MKVYVIEKWNDRGECFEIYEVTRQDDIAALYKFNPDFDVTEWMV